MPVPTNPDLPSASPIVIAESDTHVTIACEVSKTELARHVRFLHQLLEAAGRAAPPAGFEF